MVVEVQNHNDVMSVFDQGLAIIIVVYLPLRVS